MYSLLYDPFRELRRFHGQRNRGWRGFRRWGENPGAAEWLLPLDVTEREEGVVVTASVPGFKPEDIDVTIEDNVLSIHAKAEFSEETRDERFIVRERRAGTFHRSLRLPESVDADEAATNYDLGVLTVTLPKSEEKKARKLTVNAGN
ncbi:MAG: Hsp20/alpha crystallin family protein [Chloroflexi bacterium]|nr:Hsp20/alpha crystallin family protein [Chloroflexota bacterium]